MALGIMPVILYMRTFRDIYGKASQICNLLID